LAYFWWRYLQPASAQMPFLHAWRMMPVQIPKMPSGWFAIVASALISTVLGIMALFSGLKKIDTANAAIISTFEVVVVVVLAVIILGEKITLYKILGACLVIGAVIILAKSEYRTAHAQIR
jgi:drug/metabolite transporter (DMT)-like permease